MVSLLLQTNDFSGQFRRPGVAVQYDYPCVPQLLLLDANVLKIRCGSEDRRDEYQLSAPIPRHLLSLLDIFYQVARGIRMWYCKVAYEKQEPKKSAPLEP